MIIKKVKKLKRREKIRRTVLDKEEKRKRHFHQTLSTISHDRQNKKRKLNSEKLEARVKAAEKSEKSRDEYNKEKRKLRYVKEGLKEKKKNKKRS